MKLSLLLARPDATEGIGVNQHPNLDFENGKPTVGLEKNEAFFMVLKFYTKIPKFNSRPRSIILVLEIKNVAQINTKVVHAKTTQSLYV